ncbi:MAG: DUF2505 family protein [Acidimicrobiia bacterium]|nr:DUF2505 family protein [Acidimicrobiia bacterium]
MRFGLETNYAADADDLVVAYADPALYAAFADLPRASAPQVLAHRADGDTVHLRVRWFFSADLAPAARRVIDPAKLTWVQESAHDLVARTVSYVMVPDHYGDRFSCRGSYRFDPAAAVAGAVRRSDGDLRVKAPLVAKLVENAIVSGLEDQLRAEVPIVEAYLDGLDG